jgi:hypothetical protein
LKSIEFGDFVPHVKNVFAHVGTPSLAVGQGLGIKITKSGQSLHAGRKQPAEAMVKRGSWEIYLNRQGVKAPRETNT